MNVLSGKNNSILEYFRPRGKIVCVGESLSKELQLIKSFLSKKENTRLPLLLLTPSALGDNVCDQVVIFDSDKVLKQVYSLLNSYFLIFIFNSSESGIFRILGAIMASIDYSGSIPVFIDIGEGFNQNKGALFGKCYFQIDCSTEKGRKEFRILLDCIISSLASPVGFGITLTDLIRLFGKSIHLFYSISSSEDLNMAIKAAVDHIGEKLIQALPEEIERLEAILVYISSASSLNLQRYNDISLNLTKTFGKDFEIHFSSSVDSDSANYDVIIILTDINRIEQIFPISSSDYVSILISSNNQDEEKKVSSSEVGDEDERFSVLGKIFTNSEIYVFDDGGLPLFASHRPAGQEVCLYTGLFSAIQSMSSDLIGHTPDHLIAGNKRCVFISKLGPRNSQLRGVAICSEGFEQLARNNLDFSMKLVMGCMEHGEPEYAINDKIQGFLVQGFNNGTLKEILKKSNFHAS